MARGVHEALPCMLLPCDVSYSPESQAHSFNRACGSPVEAACVLLHMSAARCLAKRGMAGPLFDPCSLCLTSRVDQ
jgi:hypothetical protein